MFQVFKIIGLQSAHEGFLWFHAKKPYLIYALTFYVLICFCIYGKAFAFLETLLPLVLKYFVYTPRDCCFRVSHFMMTMLMAWDPRVCLLSL
jgi:hypothetical protein